MTAKKGGTPQVLLISDASNPAERSEHEMRVAEAN